MKKVEIKKSEGRGKEATTKLYGSFDMPETGQELKDALDSLNDVNQRSLLRILENGLLVTARPKFEVNEKSPATFEIGSHLTLEQLLASRSRQAGTATLKNEILRLTADMVAGKLEVVKFSEQVKSLQARIDAIEAARLEKTKGGAGK